MVMEAVRKSKCPLSCLVEGLERFPRVERSVRVKQKRAVLESEDVRLAVKQAEERLAGGRVFVRPSGTEPLIRILAEGEDQTACEEAAALIVRAVEAEGGVCAGS